MQNAVRLFFTTLFFILNMKVFSQCKLEINNLFKGIDSITIEKDLFIAGGNYESNRPGYASNDRMLFEGKYKTYTSDNIIPENIKNIIRSYLIKRGGNLFYSSLKLEKILITTVDSLKKHDPHSYLLKKNGYGVKKGRIKYHFEYSFFPEKNIVFAFGVSLDEKGTIISQNVIPVFKDSLDFKKNIKLCDCMGKIKKQFPKESSLPLSEVSLYFDKSKNTFSYSITFSDDSLIKKDWGNNKYNTYTIKSNIYTGELSKPIHKVRILCVD